MLIRYGYEMTFECPNPTPMVCQLDVHPSRAIAVRSETPFAANPFVASRLYADLFGNRCRRFAAPAGSLTIMSNGIIEDSGLPDVVDPAVVEFGRRPARRNPRLPGGQPLRRDGRLSQIAWDLFAGAPPGWGRVQAICDFVNSHMAFGYEHARATRTAFEAIRIAPACAAISLIWRSAFAGA